MMLLRACSWCARARDSRSSLSAACATPQLAASRCTACRMSYVAKLRLACNVLRLSGARCTLLYVSVRVVWRAPHDRCDRPHASRHVSNAARCMDAAAAYLRIGFAVGLRRRRWPRLSEAVSHAELIPAAQSSRSAREALRPRLCASVRVRARVCGRARARGAERRQQANAPMGRAEYRALLALDFSRLPADHHHLFRRL